MPARPAAGGGRWVDVDPARLPGWLNGFAVRNGAYHVEGIDAGALHIRSVEGARLALWPPPGSPVSEDLAEFIQQAQRDRRIGLLLARQASVAVGIAFGPLVLRSKVETFYVQSRTAAGGWSQQRYARRRANQARAAADDASDLAARFLLPELPALATVVTGGDRRTVDTILSHPRLHPLAVARSERFLDVGEPRRAAVEQAAAEARKVRILVREPPS